MGVDGDVLVVGRPAEEVGVEIGGLLPLFDNEIVGPVPGFFFWKSVNSGCKRDQATEAQW